MKFFRRTAGRSCPRARGTRTYPSARGGGWNPAHTIKLFGLVNRYDLREEFPIQTIRRMYLKSAVDELLWIWQKKSNNIHD